MAGKNKVKVRMSEMAKREERWAWLFIAPPFIGFMCFMAYPIVFAIIVSMSRWTGINSLWGNLVGLRNYGEILTDSKFWQSMGTTIIYMIGIPIGMILGIIIAMGLNRNLPGKRLLTTMYYVPVVSSLVAVSILWAWVFNYDYGLLNGIYKLLTGQHGPNWLGDEKMIKVSMIIFMVWKGLGGTIILYLAGLQNIPRDYYEAGGFQVFVEVQVMAANGGPNYSAATVVFYLYEKAFKNGQLGYGSAIAVILAIIIFAITALNFWGQNKWVNTDI